MSRVQLNFVSGTVADNPLLIGGTTLTSAQLAALPTIASNHAAIVLDPDGTAGAPEIVWVTAHTAGAGSATIARGKEGTTARQHLSGTTWRHTPTAVDYGAMFNVQGFGAVGDGSTNDAAAFNAAIAAAVAAKAVLVIPPTNSYYKTTGALTVTGDLTVIAYGATIQIQGYIYNSSAINLRWYGGTITDAGATQANYPFQFGAGAAASATGARLISCVARDIVFSGMNSGAWLCNSLDGSGANYNTDLHWDNLRCIKAATAGSLDAFQVVCDGIYARVTIDDGGTSGFGITSAWLKRAEWHVTARGSGPRKIVALQPYTGNGSAPYFDDVTIEAYGGQIVLNNGNLAALEVVATDVRIVADNASHVEIGNSAYDQWGHVTVEGTLQPTSAGIGALNVVCCTSFEGDVVIDGSAIASGSSRELVALGNNPASLVPHVRFKRLVVRQVAAASFTNILGALASSYVGALSILSGDVSDGVTSALYPSADLGQFGTFVVRSVLGYNPVGHAVTQPAVPASTTVVTNTTGVDCTVFVAGGTVSAVAIGGTATGLTSGAFRVPANQTIKLTYTVAPTWQWYGD